MTIPRYTREAERIFASSKTGPFILVVPSTPTHYTVQEVLADPIAKNSVLGTFTHFGNVLDLTGISVPAGTYPESELHPNTELDAKTGTEEEISAKEGEIANSDAKEMKSAKEENRLPFAVTFIGGSRTDAEVLEVARRFEEAVKAR